MTGFTGYGVRRWLGKMLLAVSFCSGVAQAEPLHLVALGDSLTHGYGLPEQDGFVPQLQAWLHARGHDVVITNAGVSGDTTAGGLARVAWAIAPDMDAMILALGGNDTLRGMPADQTRANLDGIIQIAKGSGLDVLLIGQKAPANFGPDYQQAYDAIFPELAAAHGIAFLGTFYQGLPVDDPQAMVPYLQRDLLHPNAKGVKVIVDAMGPEIEALMARVK